MRIRGGMPRRKRTTFPRRQRAQGLAAALTSAVACRRHERWPRASGPHGLLRVPGDHDEQNARIGIRAPLQTIPIRLITMEPSCPSKGCLFVLCLTLEGGRKVWQK